MEAVLYTVERDGPGRLSTMARPRVGDWLDDEMAALRRANVDVLVSMLTDSEVAELDLSGERALATGEGLRFVALATPDRSVPDLAPFRDLLDELEADLTAGRHVAGHCRMGIGRTSLVAAGLLIREGTSAEDAWSAISRARGMEVPDTPEQRAWVEVAVTAF